MPSTFEAAPYSHACAMMSRGRRETLQFPWLGVNG
jgi:hypothetical protein